MQFLERKAVTYYVRVKNFDKLLNAVMDELIQNEVDWTEYTSNHPYYGEISYSIKKDKPRRILFKACSVTDNGQMSLFPAVYAIVTNDLDCSPKEGMKFYEQRGASENFTKELKDDFKAAKVSHKTFLQNEMDFLISAFAYNLFHIFQNTVLKGADRKITMNTFRLRFQKIAVKVTRHAGKIFLRFSSAYQRQAQFFGYWSEVLQL